MPDGTIFLDHMRALFEKKYWVLLISILALGALTALSVSLKNVSFKDAQPIGREEADAFDASAKVAVESLPEVSLQSQVILWILIALLVVLVGVLLSPETRKKLLRLLFRIAFSYWALYFLFKRYPEALSALNLNLWGNAETRKDDALANIPPPVFTPPQQTPLLSYVMSLLIVLGALWLLWKFYRVWADLRLAKSSPLQEIARIAHSSLRDLSNGRESTDVILNCYFRMSDVVADKKSIHRMASMTPAEFAARLENSGLPGEPVQNLTRLFESVRYGSRKAGPKETNEAVACLTTILQYCGEPI
ncbi:MAG: DUF4129 domain-containing protein [Anaerolineales bacterium]|nr:DUF4129 domain-containing protein [Anaerolineales bacterium]